MKNKLPRPIQINHEYHNRNNANQNLSEAEKLINIELYDMIRNDNSKYPFKGMKDRNKNITIEEYELKDIDKARDLIN